MYMRYLAARDGTRRCGVRSITGHPANNRLALAKATRSHVHVFGVEWDHTSGAKNGHLAPFDRQGP